jgi:hypothetical protein
MEDFNEIFENNDEIEIIKNSVGFDKILYHLKIKLANENYDVIIQNGIDFNMMLAHGMNVNIAIDTLTDMLNIFEELEEYEKCVKIKQILDNSNL